MTTTERIAREPNSFFRATGEAEVVIPKTDEWPSELDMMCRIPNQYRERLLNKMPQVGSDPEASIPDMFLPALNKHEQELRSKWF